MYDKIAAVDRTEMNELEAFIARAGNSGAVEFSALSNKLTEIFKVLPEDIKTQSYSSLPKASEKVLDICKALTGMTRADIMSVDEKDEIAAVKLLGTLIVYGKAVENGLDLSDVTQKLRLVQKKYYALAALAVESTQNEKLIQRYRKFLDDMTPRGLSIKGTLLGAALVKAANPKANVSAKLKSLMKELKKAVSGNNASTAILAALSGFTLKGDQQLLLTAANSALSDIVIQTGTQADTGSVEGKIKALMTQVTGIQNDAGLGKGEKINKIADLLDDSELDDAVKAAVRVNAIKDDLLYTDTSKIGAALVLNQEQDEAMNSDKAVTYISAGAGSGKTRVLAGRVLKFLSEPETTPYNVIAVSFTKKSALELRSRVRKNKTAAGLKGEDLENIDNTLIGRTIHSVAYEIASLYNPRTKKADIVEEYAQFNYYERAIDLIKKGDRNDEWLNVVPVEKPVVQTAEYSALTEDGKAMGLMALNLYNTSNYIFNVKKIREGADWARINLGIFEPLVETKAILNPKHPDWDKPVEGIEGQQPITPREQFMSEIKQPGRGKTVLDRFNMKLQGGRLESNVKTANDLEEADLWFKIGATEDEIEGDRLTPNNLGLYITKAKAEYMHPRDCAVREQKANGGVSLFPAAYGAYQYLLDQEGKADFDDAMLMGVSTLSDPTALTAARARFKHILVDEAQDLNAVQRDFFGLILGTHEVSDDGKVEKLVETPTGDKSLTLIGDPKQTIYGFRGATDEQFVNGATLAQETDGQELYSLTTNYRSGRNIVNAANTLISKELGDKATQAGGICYAPIEAEEGLIQHKSATDVKEATQQFADFIKQKTSASALGTNVKYRDFGLACRTNVEVIPYALALFEEGIPFRSGVDPFKHPASKAVLSYLNLLSTDSKENFVAVKAVLKDLGINVGDRLYTQYRKLLEDKTQTILEWATRQKGKKTSLSENTTRDRLQQILPSEGNLEELVVAFNKLAAVVNAANAAQSPGVFIRMIIGDLAIPGFGKLTDSSGMTLRDKFSSKRTAKEAEEEDSPTEEGEATSHDSDAGGEEDITTAIFANPLDVLIRMVSKLNADTSSKSVTKVVQEFLGKVNKVRSDAKKPLSDFTEKDLDGMVTLDTAHGWKGLECEHLYLPMTARWPSDKINPSTELLSKEIEGETVEDRRARLLKTNKEEEARLAYVAVTRGKKSVRVISYTGAKEVKTKKGVKSLRMQPSPFIAQMGLCDVNEEATTARTASFDGIDASIWSEMARNGFDPDRI